MSSTSGPGTGSDQDGWEDVADSVLGWAVGHTAA
jgi:hypothetical protein